jgi:ribonuclease BN (tRNA processing enzyme)
MPKSQSIPAALIFFLLSSGVFASDGADCRSANGVALQILGSGGPVADDARASSGYVVWVDGKSKILVDAGGGSSLRFGQSGATFADLDHIAISHFHTDHSGDVTSLLKTGYFSPRVRFLSISGPGGRGPFPGLNTFLERLVGDDGAYAYLSGYKDGSGGLVRLRAIPLDSASRQAMPVIGDHKSAVQIEATGVPHGIVPTLAYRVRVGDRTIVFAGDQNGNDETFVDFARDADVLVMHMAVPEDIEGAGRALHAPPSVIGKIAKAANARKLVLSHFMARSLRDIDANVAAVDRYYDGVTITADDLLCVEIGD